MSTSSIRAEGQPERGPTLSSFIASAFSWLSSRDQRSLHDFYRPSELLLPQELIDHREACTAKDPSLPQRAGRTLRNLKSVEARLLAYERESKRTTPSTRSRKRVVQGVTAEQIRVRELLRPRLDIQKLSSAIVELAHQQLMEQPTNAKPRRRRRRG